MIIKEIKYVNATKEFPLMFDSAECGGKDTSELEKAYFYKSEKEAINDTENFDEPETRQVLPVKITYEL